MKAEFQEGWWKGNTVEMRAPPDVIGGKQRQTLAVIHWTAGGSLTSSVAALDTLGLTYHFLIDRNGAVVQRAPYDRRVSHAGVSAWRGKPGVNNRSIGIALCLYGPLHLENGMFYTPYGTVYNSATPVYDVIPGVGINDLSGKYRTAHYHEPISDEQWGSLVRLLKALHDEVPTLSEVVDHHAVAPTRKIDVMHPQWKGEELNQIFADRNVDRGPEDAAEPPKINADGIATPPGDTNDHPHSVYELQRMLLTLGYGPMKHDGILGPVTRSHLQAFQAHCPPLKVDGVAGPKTWVALLHALEGLRKLQLAQTRQEGAT